MSVIGKNERENLFVCDIFPTRLHHKKQPEHKGMSRLAEFVGALAAMKGQTLILMIGEATLPLKAKITAGMSLYSRLVINLPLDSTQAIDHAYQESDLRVAMHKQKPIEFLDDIKHHSFSMVIVDDAEFEPKLASKILELLEVGGTLVVLSSHQQRRATPVSTLPQCISAELPDCVLFVKADESRNPKRRGGRRGRKH